MKKGAKSENALNENALSGALISIDKVLRSTELRVHHLPTVKYATGDPYGLA